MLHSVHLLIHRFVCLCMLRSVEPTTITAYSFAINSQSAAALTIELQQKRKIPDLWLIIWNAAVSVFQIVVSTKKKDATKRARDTQQRVWTNNGEHRTATACVEQEKKL